MKAAACALGALLLTTSAGLAAEDWHTAAGAVTCPSYFQMTEAQASRNAPTWFAETGCYRQMADIPLTIIDAPRGLAAMQVRLHKATPETVWIHPYEVLGFAVVNGKREGPMPFLKARTAPYDAKMAKQRADTAAKIDADRAALHASMCAENPDLVRGLNAALLRSGNTQGKDCP